MAVAAYMDDSTIYMCVMIIYYNYYVSSCYCSSYRFTITCETMLIVYI